MVPVPPRGGRTRLFQSLLCWIMVCKAWASWLSWADDVSFNPCYVGLWSVRPRSVRLTICLFGFNPCYVGLWSVSCVDVWRAVRPIGFQSLLCWIMVCKTLTPSVPTTALSFNPCYVGLWSVRMFDQMTLLKVLKFQSLLCWIMVCKFTDPAFSVKKIFVSILVMLDYGL